MTPQIRIGGPGGAWLSTFVPVGGITLDARWPLGGYQLDASLLLAPTSRPSAIIADAPCDLLVGGLPAFTGYLMEPDWTEGTITAQGLCRAAETTVVLDASGTTTSTPDIAIDAAIARGAWKVTRPASISATAMTSGDTTAEVNYLSVMLDQWATDNGQRWYVDPMGAVRKGTDPTVPEIYILPGATELSWTTERQATRLSGRWQDTAGVLHTTHVGDGSTERRVDLTTRGPLTSTQATSILTAILAESASGSWAGGFGALAVEQMVTPGGLHPTHSQVMRMAARGLMVRLLGHRDPRPGRFSLVTDVVVGQAVWNVDERTITLTPIGSVERDFASIVESLGGQAA